MIALGYDGDANFVYVPKCGINERSIGAREEILSDRGNILEKKKTERGDALQGVVDSFSFDQMQRKITLTGWSADIGKGKSSQSIAVFYQHKFVGQGQVDQPSASIAGHYAHYSIPGNYGQSGFNFTVDFPWWMNAVNSDDIQVVAYGEDGDANFVYIDKAKVVIK